MKYKFYLKETDSLQKITRFCDGRLLFSSEGMWKNNPGVNQNLAVHITSDEEWRNSDIVLSKESLFTYFGWMVKGENIKSCAKLVLSSLREHFKVQIISDDIYSNGILKWICDNPTATEIPLDRHSDVNLNYIYMVRTKPTYAMSEEASKKIADAHKEDLLKARTSLTNPALADEMFKEIDKLFALSDYQVKELQWISNVARELRGDDVKKSFLKTIGYTNHAVEEMTKRTGCQLAELLDLVEKWPTHTDGSPVKIDVNVSDYAPVEKPFLEMKKNFSIVQVLSCLERYASYISRSRKNENHLTPLNWLKKYINEI
jgi:hypothetical protein